MERTVSRTISDQELADIAAQLPDAVVVVDASATVCWGNRAAERLMGRPLEHWLGTNGLDLLHPDDLSLAVLSLSSVQSKEVGTPIELRIATEAGWMLVELVGAPLDDGRLLMTMRDMTQRRRWEVAGNQTARFQALVQHSPTITMLLDGDGVLQSASGALITQLSQDPEQWCGRSLLDLVDEDDRAALRVALHQAQGSSATAPTNVEVHMVHGEGHTVPFELAFVSLLDDPTIEGFVVTGHDITRLRVALQDLEQLASYDNLTGVFNRRVFDTVLDREWKLAQGDGVDTYLLVADLDGFKQLNDDHGHAAGDLALKEFALILRKLARDTDLVARLGGDEFAVLQVRCGGEFSSLGFEAVLNEELEKRTWPGGLRLKASIGHQSLRRATSAADALERADFAMLEKKRQR